MMKILNKINLPALLTLLLGLGLMSGSFAQRSANAGPTDVIPAIQVSISRNLTGQYLHVIYAVGRPGALAISPVPYLDIIRTQSTSQQITGPAMTFPAVEIEKTPGRGAYNMVVFAVSASPTINWANVDVNPNPTQYTFVGIIQKPQIDAFVAQQGEGKSLQFSF